MYETEYGTGWDELEAEEAIERGYALGVAETLEESIPGEIERLIDAVESAHDRALVRLAYDKGRSRGKVARSSTDDSETVWSDLLDESERESVDVTSHRDLPPALRGLPLLDPPDDGLDRVRLPKFLTRR